MPAATIREDIVTRVKGQLDRIRTTNTYTLYGETKNYLTNLGSNCTIWRSRPFEPGEQGLILRDLDEEMALATSTNMSGAVVRQLHIQVEIVLSGPNVHSDLWKVYADVEAAIGEGRVSVWGDITKETRPRLSRSLVEQESARVAGGIFEVYIDYPTLAFRSVL
jgi:hypothetical protein